MTAPQRPAPRSRPCSGEAPRSAAERGRRRSLLVLPHSLLRPSLLRSFAPTRRSYGAACWSVALGVLVAVGCGTRPLPADTVIRTLNAEPTSDRTRLLKTLNEVPREVDKVGIAMSGAKSREDQIRFLKMLIEASRMLPLAERISRGEEAEARHFLGLTLYRQGHFEDVQEVFSVGLVELWRDMPKAYREARENAEAIEVLKTEYLQRWARIGLIAAKRERAAKGEAFDEKKIETWESWHAELGIRVGLPDAASPHEMERASEAAREAAKLEAAGKHLEAAGKRKEALDLYAQAEAFFQKIPKESAFYEEALYLMGVCSYQALSLLSHRRQTAEEKEQAAVLGRKALAQFKVYEDAVDPDSAAYIEPKTRAEDAGKREEEKTAILQRRRSHRMAIALYTPFVYFDLGDWAESAKRAENLVSQAGLESGTYRYLRSLLVRCHLQAADAAQAASEQVDFILKAAVQLERLEEAIEKTEDVVERAALLKCRNNGLNQVADLLKKKPGELRGLLEKSERGRSLLEKIKAPSAPSGGSGQASSPRQGSGQAGQAAQASEDAK